MEEEMAKAATKTKTKAKPSAAEEHPAVSGDITASVPAAAEVVTAYKAFDANMSCRGLKFEVGKTYEHAGRVEICEGGFHACENPFDVFNYYPFGSRLAVVEMSGALSRHEGGDQDSKLAAAKITIQAELTFTDLIPRAVAWILAKAKGNTATGDSGHAAATGDSGHAAATGDSGHAAATGDSGHAAATGDSGHAAATGDSGHAAATGYRGHAAATGYSGHAAATGDSGHAEVKGKSAVAASLGIFGTAKAEVGGAISLASYRRNSDFTWELVAVRSAMVGQDGVEAGKTYRLTEAGNFEETEA